MTDTERQQAGRAYLWYLLNITLLPGVAFILQIALWKNTRQQCLQGANQHARQGILGSLLAGVLLTSVTGLILFIGDFQSPYTWVIVILYFTLCHTSLILLGVLGYARASAGKTFAFLHYTTWWGD